MNRLLFSLAGCIAIFCVPVFAGTSVVTPEPKLGLLTALGVGAVVLVARKVKGR